MTTTTTDELGHLRRLYLEDLSKMVSYGGDPRPRVRHPGKWLRCESLIRLKDGITNPKVLTPHDIKNAKIWSDQHFFHRNIISFSKRPFTDLNDMHYQLIDSYNKSVKPDDVCFWVGDVGFGNDSQINELLKHFNGYKILVIGNHDFKGKKLRSLNFEETHLIYQIDVPTASLVLTHYPMDNICYPWCNIHGHLHNFPKLETGNPLHINVNCEGNNYMPFELEQIITTAKMRLISAAM